LLSTIQTHIKQRFVLLRLKLVLYSYYYSLLLRLAIRIIISLVVNGGKLYTSVYLEIIYRFDRFGTMCVVRNFGHFTDCICHFRIY